MKLNRVLLAYHFFPHYRKGVLEELANEIPIDFLADSSGIDGIKAYQFNDKNRFIDAKCHYFRGLMFQRKIVSLATFGDYDAYIFLANPNHITTWLASVVCKLRGKRVIFWGHGFLSSKKTPKNQLRRYFFSLANSFYTYGYRAKQNAMSLGFPEHSLHVGFNSLDYEHQINFRKDLPPPEQSKTLRIACVSRLTKLCRYDMLLEACALAYMQCGLQIEVDFIGDGPERQSLTEQAISLGIKSRFHGAVYDESAISKLFSAADVTVMPGKIGLTAMHSMMYGTPVISHDDFERQMPEVEAIVPGVTGNLFRYGDVHHLSETLIQSKAQFSDRENVRKNCFRMIDEIYNPKRQVDVMLRALNGEAAENGDDTLNIFKGYKK